MTAPTIPRDGGEHVRAFYGVPARIGRRVTFDAKGLGELLDGTIVDFAGQNIVVEFDDPTFPEPLPIHPTYRVTYVEAGQ